MGLKEAVKLGLSRWPGGRAVSFPRVMWTGQASVWAVMGASSERGSLGPAAMADIYLLAGYSSEDPEDTCTVCSKGPWGPLSLFRFVICGFGLGAMLALCLWGSVYLICRMGRQEGLSCNLRPWCVNH